MANPLAILGSIAAGLNTVGAGGASGLFEGEVQGEALKRRFASEDVLNRLRQLEVIRAGQPTYQITPQGSIMRIDPHGGVPTVAGTVPPRPPTDLERAHTAAYTAQAQRLGQGKAIPPEHERLFADWQAKNPGGDYLDFWKSEILPTMRGAQAHPPINYSTDARGNRTATTMVPGPNGELTPKTWNLGPIGKPMREPAGNVPRVTTTTNFKYSPRKEVTDTTEMGQINQAVNQTVNEIASNPNIQGWMQPGPMVQIAGYSTPVRREDVIADRVFKRSGIHVAVRWDGRRWVVTRAWTGGDREKTGSVREVGPPKSQPSGPEGDGDEED